MRVPHEFSLPVLPLAVTWHEWALGVGTMVWSAEDTQRIYWYMVAGRTRQLPPLSCVCTWHALASVTPFLLSTRSDVVTGYTRVGPLYETSNAPVVAVDMRHAPAGAGAGTVVTIQHDQWFGLQVNGNYFDSTMWVIARLQSLFRPLHMVYA